MERPDSINECVEPSGPQTRNEAVERAQRRTRRRTALIWLAFLAALTFWDLKLDLWAISVVQFIRILLIVAWFIPLVGLAIIMIGGLWIVTFLVYWSRELNSMDPAGLRATRVRCRWALVAAMAISVVGVRFAGVHPSTSMGYMVQEFDDERDAFQALESRYLRGELKGVPPDRAWLRATFHGVGQHGPGLAVNGCVPVFLPGAHEGAMRLVLQRGRGHFAAPLRAFVYDLDAHAGDHWDPIGWSRRQSVELGGGWSAMEYQKDE